MGIKVMSFNVRWDNPDDGEDRWELRKPVVAELINKHHPLLLGLQEPHKHQVEELAELLPGYAWFGSGRSIAVFGLGEEHREFNPVFYDTAALTLGEHGTFWYSDTPFIPGTKWSSSAFPRIATWGRFTVNDTGKQLCFVCTHFDHESEEARTKAAQLLLEKLPEVSGGLPTVVVGDLNCGEGSEAHSTLAGALSDCSSGCCSIAPDLLGKVGTFVGFDGSIDSQIDFIFTSAGLTPASYGTIPDLCPNGRCPSDHRPILAELEFAA